MTDAYGRRASGREATAKRGRTRIQWQWQARTSSSKSFSGPESEESESESESEKEVEKFNEMSMRQVPSRPQRRLRSARHRDTRP